MFQLESIIRRNILALKPYSSARSEFEGTASVFLDANENSFGATVGNYNRYPDPLQHALKEKIRALKAIPQQNIFLGNGSDEPIDLLIRATCNPGVDNIVAPSPSYGMYEVSAATNDVELRKVLLKENFQPDVASMLAASDEFTKLIFICSPNNPTGNIVEPDIIRELLQSFNGLVVVDEAYIDFIPEASWLSYLNEYPNLVILQTFSKAWGLAALRLGMAFASRQIIDVLNKIKPPYNISEPVQELALKALDQQQQMKAWAGMIGEERTKLATALEQFSFVANVFPADANFLLVRVTDANRLYQYLLKQGIVVRNRNGMPLCDECLRITIGTTEENNVLIEALNNYN